MVQDLRRKIEDLEVFFSFFSFLFFSFLFFSFLFFSFLSLNPSFRRYLRWILEKKKNFLS